MQKWRRNNKKKKSNKKADNKDIKQKNDDSYIDDEIICYHTTKQRIDAAYNDAPYTKQKLAIPTNSSQVSISVKDHRSWDKFFLSKTLPGSNDWLHEFPSDQKGQTFNSWYKFIERTSIYSFLTDSNKNSIGLITVGTFNIYLTQKIYPLFDILSQFTKVYYFGLNIEILEPISTKGITSRYNENSNNKQLKTKSISYQLKKIKKKYNNLCCLMGISIIDLYPDDSWNFVFGEASIQDSVGIFSFARYFPGFYKLSVPQYFAVDKDDKLKNLKAMIDGEVSNDDKNWLNKVLDEKEQIIFIRRCLGVLLHEIGHLFGLEHCPYFECLMNGANHLQESDAAPLHLCPVCLHKLYFASKMMEKAERNKKRGNMKHENNDDNKNDDDESKEENEYLDILTRYQRLNKLYDKYGLIEEGNWCKKRASFVFDSCTLNKKDAQSKNDKDKDTEMKDD